MPVLVLIGFAGVLVAAVATGVLAGRCFRHPGMAVITWTVASLGLAIALAAQSMGFASGFDQVTFRTVQLAGLLLTPLWLAWSLVELAVANDTVRFGTRLISSALTVVAAVILATDPLRAQPFSKAWPLTSVHFGPIARSALDVVQAVAVLAALACVGVALAGRGRSRRWRRSRRGLAVLMAAGLRFPLPAPAAYPLLSTAAAGLVLFGASRIGEGPRRQTPGAEGDRGGRRGGVRDDGGRYQPGDEFWPEDGYRPADGSAPGSQSAPGASTRPTASGRATPGLRPGARVTSPVPGRAGRRRPRRGPTAGSRSSPCSTTGSPTSTGSPRKWPSGSARASRTPWCTSSTSCRTPRCSGSSTRSTGTGPRSIAREPAVHAALRGRAPVARARDQRHRTAPQVRQGRAAAGPAAGRPGGCGTATASAATAPPPQAPPSQQPPRPQSAPAAAGRGPQRPPGPPGPPGPRTQGTQGPAGDPRLQPPPSPRAGPASAPRRAAAVRAASA